MSGSAETARRSARWFTGVHALLIATSIVAFQLVVDRPAPGWVDPRLWTAAYGHGMSLTGPLYIVSGFAAALAGTVATLGAGPGLTAAGLVVLVSLGMELLGTSTGFPFGAYGYGPHLGIKVLALVPIVIPLSWFLMLYASLGVAVRFQRGRLGTALIAALGLLAWDVLMDPTMSAVFPFWSWHSGGVYYGMPLVNWFGWMLTGFLIAVVMLEVAGERISPLGGERLPLVIYALNGVFPLALALQHGMHGAALLGGGAMSLYLASVTLPLRGRRGASLALPRA